MIAFLRFIGMMNAAIWFGAAIFFTFGVGPAFFSPEMAKILPRPHAGAAAQVVLERYFYLHYICGGVAILHMAVDWLYTGRPIRRITLWILGTIALLSLIGGLAIQPHLQKQHLLKYGVGTTAEQRAAATRSFTMWHGISQGTNLVILIGLFAYTWRTINAGDGTRFAPTAKFRG